MRPKQIQQFDHIAGDGAAVISEGRTELSLIPADLARSRDISARVSE